MADLKIRIRSIEGCEPCVKACEYYGNFRDTLRGFLDIEVEVEKVNIDKIVAEGKIPAVPVIEVEGSCGKKEVVGFGDDSKTQIMEAIKNVLCIGKKAEESKTD